SVRSFFGAPCARLLAGGSLMKTLAASSIIVLALVSVSFGAAAYQGNTDGGFSAVAKTGTYSDWYVPPWLFNDNIAADAVLKGGDGNNFVNGGDELRWGANNQVLPPGISPYSSVQFVGNPAFGPVAPDEQFYIGTLIYTNGTILQGTGAYVATL